jgi:hypothetical protein
MSDLIYYKNGEETFRISPPTVGTKCPETKLEVKKMTEIEKTEGEIKVLQAKLELLKEMEKHKSPAEEAFKRVYCRYPDKYGSAWDIFEKGYARAQKDYKVGEYQPTPQEPEENKWKTVALRFGETLSSIGPCGYYGMTADEWLEWANDTYEKNADELLPLVKRGIRKNEVEEYQPTSQEPEELKTLYQMWNDGECRDDICYLVKIWMSQYADNVMCGEYKKGYEYCLLVLEENLK